MSDADDAGPDDSGFDKEAERERLREKYEAEQADREAAQQMSDLLLKGATMTNAHCGNCGSPIFRSDGQEFCPNCSGQAAGADAGQAETGAGQAQQAGTAAEPAEADAGSTGATEQQTSPDEQLANVISSDGDDAAPDQPSETGGTSMADRAVASVQSTQQESSASQSGDESAQQTATPTADQSTTPATPPAGGDATLADAQQSLLNAITQHARAATDADPRTARDHLEAASEAAEALAEISQ
ncbi:Sjogren's syndrome/scleroderma autoantigen 1 family protein [Salinarchaeum chitinilyticum]